MIRKSLLITAAILLIGSGSAWAQSQMTDQQVAAYLSSEVSKGTSQQVIVRNLMGKGVTINQLNRVRKNYFSGQNTMAAPNSPLAKTIERNRKTQQAQERQQANDAHLEQMRPVVPPYENINNVGLYNEQTQDSLLFYMESLTTSKKIFGHDIFNKENLTFEPNMNMATPANYTLGAGDQVIIDVWGASQKTFDCTVSPDGVIVIDEVGPIRLAGLSVQAATAAIKSKLGQYYGGSRVSLAVGQTRTIQVQVVGEVEMPGTYSLSGLASAFNALYSAGGINDIGTLRNIKVYRNNRVLTTVDVYDYLINGNSSSDVRLQDKDIIVVGPYDCLVQVDGKIKRPMYYEMRDNESVKQLLRFAGGYTGDAYTKNVRLSRKAGDERSIHTIDEFEMGGFIVKDGDEVYVDSVVMKYSNMVEVRGAVNHAGQFQLGNNIQSVRELIEAADGLREDAYQERAVMHRQKEDLSLEMVGVNLKGILDGTEADIALQKNDMLFVPSKTEMRGKWNFNVKGEVVYPGQYPYADNTTLQDIILMAGGMTDAASLAHVNVYRRISNPTATNDDDRLAEQFSFQLDENFRMIKDTIFYLKPFDEIYIRRSPGYEEQQNVSIGGCINFAGQYTMTKKDYRLSDLVKAAGGFTTLAYVPGARLMRRLTDDERIQRDNALRQAQIQLYEQALKSENAHMDFEKADTLLSMKMNLDDSYPVAVDLDKAISNPGGSYDIVLRKGDVLSIPQFTNTVKVSGEVSYPISMNYKKGEKLKYYINHAGGFANRAKKRAVYVVYANGAVEKVDRGSSKAVQPGCEIVVPTKEEGQKLSMAEKMAIGTGTTSVATMIVSLMNMIRNW
ncbi:MAG: SLBB domain-containing protein [Bacteroidaceae bacterium]|nr:SLBB domain-containing protein [Bacteroidaceae bacterium]